MLRRRRGRIWRELLTLLLVLGTGALSGIVLAQRAADFTPLSGAVHVGAWRAWPKAGVAGAMPYARVRYHLDGALPPSPTDRLEFVALNDDEGRALAAGCTYRLTGAMFPVRYWLLGVFADKGLRATAELAATDILYGPKGRFGIILSRRLQPGNWLLLPSRGNVRLVLQLFGISPLVREKLLRRPPLKIERLRCT